MLLLAAAPCEGGDRTADVPLYLPAAFTNSARIEKVRGALPEIERLYREHAVSNHFPGMSWGVVLDGQLVLSGSYGLSDLERKTPATTRTLFRIASMSKSVTAVAILQLRDRGKLRLDDPISRHLPETRKLELLTKDAPNITIRDLLTHSAGFPEDNPWGDWQLEDRESDLVDLMRGGVSFANPPGVAYEYSNLGFALLGRIVTRASGMPYQRCIEQRILLPLGMPETEWEYTKVSAELLARGYRWEEERWKPEPIQHDGAYGAMGGLISSVEEFARYIALHLQAWPPRNEEDRAVLKRSSIREMHQLGRVNELDLAPKKADGSPCPTVTGYGYGLGWTRDCEGRIAIGHSGGLPGYGSNWRILPEHGLGVVLLANRTYANAGAANTKVIDLLVKQLGLEKRALPPSSILERRRAELMRFLPDWPEAAPASGIFSENFFPDQSLELRRKGARELFQKVGAVVRVGPMRPLNNLRGTFLYECERGQIEVWFTLSPENPPLVQELKIRELPKEAAR